MELFDIVRSMLIEYYLANSLNLGIIVVPDRLLRTVFLRTVKSASSALPPFLLFFPLIAPASLSLRISLVKRFLYNLMKPRRTITPMAAAEKMIARMPLNLL